MVILVKVLLMLFAVCLGACMAWLMTEVQELQREARDLKSREFLVWQALFGRTGDIPNAGLNGGTHRMGALARVLDELERVHLALSGPLGLVMVLQEPARWERRRKGRRA